MADNNFDVTKAKKFDTKERIKELRPNHLLKDIVGVTQGMVCVDIGSGTGTFSFPMLSLVGENGAVYAVDDSQVMLNHILKKNPPANLKTVCASANNTGLDNNIADFCLLSFIMHEVKEPVSLLKEAFRLLNNGGKVCVIEWKAELTSHGPPIGIRITSKHLKELFNQARLSYFEYIDWTSSHYIAIGGR